MTHNVCTLNGQCSGICGGASFLEEHLTLAEHGKMDILKINDDDNDDEARSTAQIDCTGLTRALIPSG